MPKFEKEQFNLPLKETSKEKMSGLEWAKGEDSLLIWSLMDKKARNPIFSFKEREEAKQTAEKWRLELEARHKEEVGISPFDPKEALKKIWPSPEEKVRLTPEERKELKRMRLEAYKKELRWQTEGLAYIERNIYEGIQESVKTRSGLSWRELMLTAQNPHDPTIPEFLKKSTLSLQEAMQITEDNTNLDKLKEMIESKVNAYRLTEEQVNNLENKAYQLVLRRCEVHKICQEFQEKYGKNWERELFRECFAVPKEFGPGEVEVVETPFCLYFRCHNAFDYALVCSNKFLEERPDVSFSDIEAANHSGGASIMSPPQLKDEKTAVALTGALALENSHGRNFDLNSLEILIHEEEHSIQGLFHYPVELFEGLSADDTPEMVDITQDESLNPQEQKEKFEVVLTDRLRSIRFYFEKRACDELLAFYKNSKSGKMLFTIQDALQKLKRTQEKDGLEAIYDYCSQSEDLKRDLWDLEEEVELYTSWPSETYTEIKPSLVDEVARRVFRDEYFKVLDEAADALTELAEYRSKEDVLTLLRKKPLRKWPLIAKRIREEIEKYDK